MDDDDLLDALRAATHRLVRGVDRMPDDAWSGPSLLPGWSRAHVVAHLTLQGEEMARDVEGARTGDQVPVSSTGQHDDLDHLAGAPTADLRERLLGSTTRVAEALAGSGALADLPSDLADRRWREVEIHHADLDAGYSSADWSPAFVDRLLDAVTADPAPPTDAVLQDGSARRWVLGAGGPVVRGPAHALAWWGAGRAPGAGGGGGG
ncbi:MAG: maleylpyruvate isomerase family mycothiol-dependent enzyme, partial [Nocardioides sp.]|nr:maleylpyruvate isomerase family mycothiol-dependent enzyme [Nocardioides sp.]